MTASPPLLVLVHPGSACGSADFNIGKTAAAAARDAIADELHRWIGGLIVVDGDLSDEIPTRSRYGAAISKTLETARSAGFPSERIEACAMTDDWIAEVRDALDPHPRKTVLRITGAWRHPDDRQGCVDAVEELVRDMGFVDVMVLDSVVDLDG